MIELTETLAGHSRKIWIAVWNVLRLVEMPSGGTAITMIDGRHVQVTDDPKKLATLIERAMGNIYQTPDYRE